MCRNASRSIIIFFYQAKAQAQARAGRRDNFSSPTFRHAHLHQQPLPIHTCTQGLEELVVVTVPFSILLSLSSNCPAARRPFFFPCPYSKIRRTTAGFGPANTVHPSPRRYRSWQCCKGEGVPRRSRRAGLKFCCFCFSVFFAPISRRHDFDLVVASVFPATESIRPSDMKWDRHETPTTMINRPPAVQPFCGWSSSGCVRSLTAKPGSSIESGWMIHTWGRSPRSSGVDRFMRAPPPRGGGGARRPPTLIRCCRQGFDLAEVRTSGLVVFLVVIWWWLSGVLVVLLFFLFVCLFFCLLFSVFVFSVKLLANPGSVSGISLCCSGGC